MTLIYNADSMTVNICAVLKPLYKHAKELNYTWFYTRKSKYNHQLSKLISHIAYNKNEHIMKPERAYYLSWTHG